MASNTETARKIVVTIPMSPPPSASPNNRSASHWRTQRGDTAAYRAAAYHSSFTATWSWDGSEEPGPADVPEHIVWPRSLGTLPDPDSLPTYCKAALDGIVDAGLIAGDSAKFIRQVSASQEKGTETQGQTVITLTEVEP